MFKINESVYDEVIEQLEINLKKTASNLITEKNRKLIEVLDLLNKSAEILEHFNFEKESNIITKLTILASKGDPHTEHLTYEKMVNNLKHKGIMFDADDKKYEKTHEGPSEYKREKLEDEYLDEIMSNEYDKLIDELNENNEEDTVEI